MKKKMGAPGGVKSSIKRRTVNNGNRAKAGGGAPFNEQDIKRRLGNFTGAGEHARQGGRAAGLVGQKKGVFRTDNKKSSRSKAK